MLWKKIRNPFPNPARIAYHPPAMSQKQENEATEIVPLNLELDAATIAWLARLARTVNAHPADIVSSMLRDIRIDDEAADAVGETKH